MKKGSSDKMIKMVFSTCVFLGSMSIFVPQLWGNVIPIGFCEDDAMNTCFGRKVGPGNVAQCSISPEPCTAGPGAPPGYNCKCKNKVGADHECSCWAVP